MKKMVLILAALALTTGWAFAEPVVDGKVAAGEYANSKKVIDGKAVLSWAGDGKGGLFVALSTKAKGWLAVGLGAKVMNGATIYFGFVGADGKPVFTEQAGKGHRHTDSGKKTVDASSVTMAAGATILEFHLPADKLPFTGKSVSFITAFSDVADLVTFHEDNYDTGSFPLP
jgi:hypothetical protein